MKKLSCFFSFVFIGILLLVTSCQQPKDIDDKLDNAIKDKDEKDIDEIEKYEKSELLSSEMLQQLKSKMDSDFVAKIINFERKGEYELAITTLYAALDDNLKIENVNYLNNLILSRLEYLNTQHYYLCRHSFKIIDSVERLAYIRYIHKKDGTHSGREQTSEKGSRGNPSKIEKINIELVDSKEAEKVMEEYDLLASVIVALINKLKKHVTNPLEPANNDDIYLEAKNNSVKLLNQIKAERTRYLSYTIISPYLFESNRLLFFADRSLSTLEPKNKDKLDKAVKMLATACHKNWLMESTQKTREQFIAVQRELKSIAGTAEMEEYKVITTLSDTLDSTHATGANAWIKRIMDPKNK